MNANKGTTCKPMKIQVSGFVCVYDHVTWAKHPHILVTPSLTTRTLCTPDERWCPKYVQLTNSHCPEGTMCQSLWGLAVLITLSLVHVYIHETIVHWSTLCALSRNRVSHEWSKINESVLMMTHCQREQCVSPYEDSLSEGTMCQSLWGLTIIMKMHWSAKPSAACLASVPTCMTTIAVPQPICTYSVKPSRSHHRQLGLYIPTLRRHCCPLFGRIG